MKQQHNNLIAVAPATKRLGAVVFSKSELVYFSVETFSPPRTEELIKRQTSQFIQRLIEKFEPSTIVVKLLGKQQSKSKKLQLVINQIQKDVKASGIRLQQISFPYVKKKLCLPDKPTKANTFKALSQIFPELAQFVHSPSRWQTAYYDSLLSAAAVGFIVSECAGQDPLKNNN